jgi:hypothetical protein
MFDVTFTFNRICRESLQKLTAKDLSIVLHHLHDTKHSAAPSDIRLSALKQRLIQQVLQLQSGTCAHP